MRLRDPGSTLLLGVGKNGKIIMEGRKDSVVHLPGSLPGVTTGSLVESICEF